MGSRHIPKISRGALDGGGGPPVSSQDRFAPKYLVGNVPAGDTAAAYSTGGFVYLSDPGDGSGVAAALALAANTPGDVWVRPGTYTLVTSPLTVPAGVVLRGAGEQATIFATPVSPAAAGGISAFNVFGEIRDVGVVLSDPSTVNASGALGVVVVQATGKARRVRVTASAIGTPARLGAISAAIEVLAGGFTEDTNVLSFPSVGAVAIYDYLLLGGSAALTRLVRPRSSGTSAGLGGIGSIFVHNVSHVMIEEPEIINPLQVGIFIQAEETSQSDVQITDPRVVWDYADSVFGVARSAIVIQANQLLSAKGVLDSVRVTRGYYDNFQITGLGSRALQFLAVGAGFASVVKNCEVIGATCRNWDEAGHAEGTGISVANANGIIDTDLNNNTVGISNVNDADFRTGGNWPIAAWAPSSSPNLALWIDPASILGVSPAVTGWNDLSGHAFNFAVVAGAPTQAVFTNGQKGVTFNGIADSLGAPATPAVYAVGAGTNAEYHVYIVARQNGAGGADNTSAGYFHLPPYIADNGNTWGVFQRTVAGVNTIVHGARSLTAARFSAVPAAPDVSGTPSCIHAWRTLDGLLHITVGGGPEFTVAMDAAVNFPGTGTILQLAQSASGGFLACTIGEIFIIDGPLTNTEQLYASEYVTAKWGVAA